MIVALLGMEVYLLWLLWWILSVVVLNRHAMQAYMYIFLIVCVSHMRSVIAALHPVCVQVCR